MAAAITPWFLPEPRWEQRAASISRFDAGSESVFALQKSRAFQDAESGLDPAASLQVQDEIISLGQGPAETDLGEGDGVRLGPVPQTSLWIRYVADKTAQRIRILGLVNAGPEVGGGQQP